MQFEIDLNQPPEKMREFIESIPLDHRQSLNEVLSELVSRVRCMQALNAVCAIQNAIESHGTDDGLISTSDTIQ